MRAGYFVLLILLVVAIPLYAEYYGIEQYASASFQPMAIPIVTEETVNYHPRLLMKNRVARSVGDIQICQRLFGKCFCVRVG
uniref:Secreted protein n=1 Tax=Panagrellus redivivus TaxID=6233 RepID=A0A7E4W8U7_PANRE